MAGVRVRLRPADALGSVDEFFLGHVLSIENRPPLGLSLAFVEIDKLTGKLAPRQSDSGAPSTSARTSCAFFSSASLRLASRSGSSARASASDTGLPLNQGGCGGATRERGRCFLAGIAHT
jgi:hypothetical protein